MSKKMINYLQGGKMKREIYNEKDRKNLKGISKALYILSKIGKVFTIIAIPLVILSIVLILVISRKFDYKENTLFFNEEPLVSFKEDSEGLTIVDKEGNRVNLKIEINDEANLIRIKKIIDETSKEKIVTFVCLALVSTIIVLVITWMLLRQYEKLFKNISDFDTPFKDENVLLLRNICQLLIIEVVVSIIISFVLQLLFFNIDLHFNTINIFKILVAFIIYYIFKYGTMLQKKSKLTINDVCE